ncbi:glycosyltransferase [Aestuariibaculum suncheonense]|uniref:Glycosyltransferase n=1 Tax=Aestuariibaculum suncheonense TaxID=1028745 RepID=A0A8J6Q5Q0_9FLAO|nr:glycosyltransferase [Aestuariibaculum suncheonense]MBD0834506.1 glycosyltransferase [Aestuariibaculum suncheonense]
MKRKKIALVGFRLNKGGSERVMAHLSNFFDSHNIEVYIVTFHDDVAYNYSGTLFNLGQYKSNVNTIFNKIKRFQLFYKYIKTNDFDFIIDFRFRVNLFQEIFISKFIYTTNTIYTIHSSKLDEYIPKSRVFAKFLYNSSYAMVSINRYMKTLVEQRYGFKNGDFIYNPIDISAVNILKDESISFKGEFIIGVGEFETNIKQFDVLIKAYSKSELPKNNIALFILGEGVQRNRLLQIAKDYKVAHLVHLMGFKKNPYKYISKAKFFVLTSEFEGFPMVLLEALACGIPVVAFDCLTGPREIIQNENNGLIIKNQNKEELIAGMNQMVSDEKLYEICKFNAVKSVEKFSLDVVGKQWLKLMRLN